MHFCQCCFLFQWPTVKLHLWTCLPLYFPIFPDLLGDKNCSCYEQNLPRRCLKGSTPFLLLLFQHEKQWQILKKISAVRFCLNVFIFKKNYFFILYTFIYISVRFFAPLADFLAGWEWAQQTQACVPEPSPSLYLHPCPWLLLLEESIKNFLLQAAVIIDTHCASGKTLPIWSKRTSLM